MRQDIGLSVEEEGLELLLVLTLSITLCHVIRQPAQKGTVCQDWMTNERHLLWVEVFMIFFLNVLKEKPMKLKKSETSHFIIGILNHSLECICERLWLQINWFHYFHDLSLECFCT